MHKRLIESFLVSELKIVNRIPERRRSFIITMLLQTQNLIF